MHSTTLFRELCSSAGLDDLEFSAQGNLTLCFDGLHNITVCLNPEDKAVLFYAAIGSATLLAQQDVTLRLLQCSLLGADTGGGALGLYQPAQMVMLWKRHDDNFATVDALRQALEAFLAELVRWKQKWANGTVVSPQEAAEQTLDQRPQQPVPQQPEGAAPPLSSSSTKTLTENLSQFGLRV